MYNLHGARLVFCCYIHISSPLYVLFQILILLFSLRVSLSLFLFLSLDIVGILACTHCVHLATRSYPQILCNPLLHRSSISARSSTRIRFIFRDHEKVASYNAALLNDNIAICVWSMFHLEQFRFTRHVGHIFSYTSKFEYLHL